MMLPRYDQLPEYTFAMDAEDETLVYARIQKIQTIRKALTKVHWTYINDYLTLVCENEETQKQWSTHVSRMEYSLLSLCRVFVLCFRVLEHCVQRMGKEPEVQEEEDPYGEEQEDSVEEVVDYALLQPLLEEYMQAFHDLEHLEVLYDGAQLGIEDATLKLSALVGPYRAEMLLLIRAVYKGAITEDDDMGDFGI